MTDLPTYPVTDEGLSGCLAALGTTADAVATILSGYGFRGRPGNACRCPIANYVHAALQIDDTRRVEVFLESDDDTPHIVVSGLGLAVLASADGTAATAAFIRAFDAGRYPDLIEGAVDAA